MKMRQTNCPICGRPVCVLDPFNTIEVHKPLRDGTQSPFSFRATGAHTEFSLDDCRGSGATIE